MVGLADLKKHFEVIKKCNMTLSGEYCYFNLSGVNTIDFMDVLNYKSWVYKAFQKMVNIRYVYIIKKLEKGNTVVRTSVGFAPILLRYLKIKGFQIRDEDIEVFKARTVIFPDFKINLYDFQERMVNDWLSTGGIGVIKSPTGSGKCAKGNTLILTDRGIIKIEDIVHGISDSENKDKDTGQLSLYDCIESCDDESRYLYDENIKSVSNAISISKRLKYEPYKICGKYDMGINDIITLKTSMGYEISGTPEHKIVVIDNNGNLNFKRLENITNKDHVAISYNTNIFNDRLELHYHFRPSKFDSNSYALKNIECMNSDIARLVGYVIAEGSCIHGDSTEFLSISNYDRETIDDIVSICEKIGVRARCDYEEGKNEGNPIGVKISSKMIIGFMYYLGYMHMAKNKEVPWAILQSDRDSQISFIRAMFDSDGTVYYGESDDGERTRTKSLVEYYSSSHELCRQLQIMLLNMGIISRLNIKKGVSLEYRGEIRHYEKSYRLSINGGEILKFVKLIGFGLSRKKEILNKCIEDLESRDRWTDVTYPNIDKKLKVLHERLKLMGKRGEIIKTWEEDFDIGYKSTKISRRKSISLREYLISYGFDKPMWAYITGERSPSKETLEKILHILSPASDMVEYKYLKVLSEKFIFDNVEDIKYEKEKVYDLTVDNVHSYIGNGIVNHNTIIGCSAIKKISRKTLILVHTSDLLVNVWNDSLAKSFGYGIMGQIGIIGGGLTDQDRVEMRLGVRSGDFEENIRKDIVIATFQTLMNRLDKLTQYKFGLMIVDETHHVPSNMFRKVNSVIRAPYKLGLSATLERLDGMTKGIFGQLGDVQSKVSIRELINRGILAEPRFQSPIIVDRGIIDSIQDSGLSGLNYSRLIKKKSASSQKKKDFVVNTCKNIAARDRKFLLFTDYVNAEDVFVRDMYADSLIKDGVSVSVIDQGMTADERGSTFGFLESGDISGIVFGKLGSEGVNIPSVDVVVMANAIKCVSGDTLTPTDKGIIRAEDLENVKPGTVSTMNLEDGSIVRADISELYHFDEEDTIRIITNNGYEIEGSLSHMVIVKDKKDNLEYKSLSNIDIGDEVVICGSNIYGKDVYLDYFPDVVHQLDKYVYSVINRINSSDLTYKIGGYRYKYVKIYYEELKNMFSPDRTMSPESLKESIRYRFNKRGVSTSRPKYDHKNDKWYYTFDLTYDGIHTARGELRRDVTIPQYVTEDLAEFLGYVVSEGYVDSHYNTVEIVNLDDYMVERLTDLFMSLFDYDIRLSILEDRNNIKRVRCHSKTILEFLNYLDIEHRAGEKVVPRCILRAGKNIQLAFLRSLFAGDGGVTNRNNVIYGSKSKRLCDEIHIMLLNMGIVSKKDSNGWSWYVSITSEEADSFMRNVGFSDDREFEYDVDRHNHRRVSTYHYKDGNVMFFDSVSYKKKGKNKLYDMNIDKYHSFIAGGFINHNSPITFTQRVGRAMRRIPGKDWCDVYEVLLDLPTELKWSDFNFAEYRAEGFQKLVYKVE